MNTLVSKFSFKTILWLYISTILTCNYSYSYGQSYGSKVKYVNNSTLNVRSGPGTNYDVVDKVYQGDKVEVAFESGEWSRVQIPNGRNGYVFSAYLSNTNLSSVNTNTYKPNNTVKNQYADWTKLYLSTGEAPPCNSIDAKYDFSLDNYLKVNVGSNTDVVIKIMNLYNDECIRIAYIGSKSTYSFKNIPQGKYYLKIAYGKDLRQDKSGFDCIIKFASQALYEKGTDILDFNKQHRYNGYSLPSFELSLDVISSNPHNGFNSKNIDEDEFNE